MKRKVLCKCGNPIKPIYLVIKDGTEIKEYPELCRDCIFYRIHATISKLASGNFEIKRNIK